MCHSLNQPRLLVIALNGQFRYTLMTDKLSRAIQIAERVHPLAQEQNDPALMIGAYLNLACTLYCLGDFESAREYARQGVQIWRSEKVQSDMEEYLSPVCFCLTYWAAYEWHFGEIAARHGPHMH